MPDIKIVTEVAGGLRASGRDRGSVAMARHRIRRSDEDGNPGCRPGAGNSNQISVSLDMWFRRTGLAISKT